jgi:hypothetical protein
VFIGAPPANAVQPGGVFSAMWASSGADTWTTTSPQASMMVATL